jgi:hypothetical protein
MSIVILQDKVVTVRKVHLCAWCDERIEMGETVPYRSYVWEDGIASEWLHPECREAMRRVPYDELEEGYYPGDYTRGGTEYLN